MQIKIRAGLIAGILKFIGCILFIGCLVIILFEAKANKYDVVTITILMTISFIILGLYVYYLFQNGIWNFINTSYKFNIFLFIGLLIHLIYCILLCYFCIKNTSIITTIPCVLVYLLIGLYDIKKFREAWVIKRTDRQLPTTLSQD
jgi:hypothetical protein